MQLGYFALPALIPEADVSCCSCSDCSRFAAASSTSRAGTCASSPRGWHSASRPGRGNWGEFFQLPEGQFAPIDWQVRYGFGIVTEQWLCFTFIGGMILLLAFRPQWRSRLDWVGTAGRMALTNYMLQAAALDFIVSGDGLSLRLRPAAGMLAAAGLFAGEVLFSRWWLARYRFGPCEWIWRSLTYGSVQPMRRRAIAEPAGV